MTEFINDMLKQIIDRENALRAELRKLKEAKSALKAVDGGKSKPKTAICKSASKDKVSYKDMILGVLKTDIHGLEIDEIMRDVVDVYNVVLERTTVSPTLTRIKNEGEIVSFAGKWHYKPNIENNQSYKSFYTALEASTNDDDRMEYYDDRRNDTLARAHEDVRKRLKRDD